MEDVHVQSILVDELRYELTIHGNGRRRTPAPLPPPRAPSSITAPSSDSRAPAVALRKKTIALTWNDIP